MDKRAPDPNCIACKGTGRHAPIVAWPAVDEYEDKRRRNALPDSVECGCVYRSPAPKPTIPADDREEVARAIKELRIKLRNENDARLAKDGFWPDHAFEPKPDQYADAAISTLQRLGWKK